LGLSLAEAEAEVTRVIKVVDTWQQHFAQVGVSEEDIESLALRIDGEGLWGQRRGWFVGGRLI
jgi:serine/threonine-protein kinase HipA